MPPDLRPGLKRRGGLGAAAPDTTADGALYLTVLDLARWDAALDARRLLSGQSWESMWTPVVLADGSPWPYGLGWDIEEQRGYPTLEHGGSWQGFRAHVVRYVEQRLTVIVLTNLAQARPGIIARAVAGLVDTDLRVVDPTSTLEDPDPVRTARLREVLLDWSQAAPSPEMGAALRRSTGWVPAEDPRRAALARRLDTATAFRFLAEDDVSHRGIRRRGEPVARIVYCALEGEGPVTVYRFHLSPTGQVVDFGAEDR